MTGGVVAIVNAKAGGATDPQQQEELAARIHAALPAAQVVFAGENEDVTALAREAVSNGAGLVIAGGGDGTINSVVTAVAGTETVLGVLPMGTLNHFARDLGIPADPDAALAVIAAGHVAPVDTGEVNGRAFINNSALGLYPGIVGLTERAASRPRRFKRLTRMLRLVAATARVLARYHLLRIRVDSQGRQRTRTTPAVFIGNNEYVMEGLKAGTRQRLDDGQLLVVIAHQRRALPLLWSGLRHLAGFRKRPDDFERVSVTELRIETHHRHLDVTLDGELLRLEAPLHYRIRPGALRVAVPAPD